MAQVKIESIIEHLDYEMKRALEDAVKRAGVEEHVNRNRLFKEFVKAVGRKCSSWENVPDNYVQH
jgi:hypothetical protein